jgi:hypothetical protein
MTDGFKDRGAALILFGAFQILLGVAALCMLFGFAAAVELQSRNGGPAAPMPMGAVVSNVIFYAVAAAYFFTAGVGSIRKRRWARALSLVVSAIWLVLGILCVVAVAILAPHLMVLIPPSQTTTMFAILFITMAVTGILLPLVMVAFYRGPNVKATCEAADPVIRWTDRVPLPIVALVLMMGYGAVSMLATATYGVIPLFGTIVTGAPAVITVVALAGLLGYLSVQLFRMKRSAWWTVVLLHVIGGVAGAFTVLRTDMDKLYAQMGIGTQQFRAMNFGSIYHDPLLWALMAVCWAAMLAYLIWTRRFFDAPPPLTRAGDVAA